MGTIKTTLNDSLFTHMFGDENKEYLLKLYQALHPEDLITQADISRIENGTRYTKSFNCVIITSIKQTDAHCYRVVGFTSFLYL